ncbi:MAG: kelch repeat-containing protein [Holophaga sp.]|nr:kelch repeat-containing protein [Holophaga sp.]
MLWPSAMFMAMVLALLAGCGSSSAQNTILTISPATVAPRETLLLSTSGGSGTGLTWSLTSNNSGGAIGAGTGLYTAGSTGSVSDTVLVTDSQGHTAQRAIPVTADLSINGASSTAPRGSLPLSTSGGSGTGLTWSLTSNNSGGAIDAGTGVYTVGSTGSVSDTVLVTDSLGNTAQRVFTVTAGLSISGAGPTAPRGSLPFSASGGSGQGLTWTFASNNSGGAIVAGTGVYTAGSTGSVSDTVLVTDSLGNTAQRVIAVTVGLGISGASSTAPRGSLSFSASGGTGQGLTWTFASNNSGGAIVSSTGVYTAGSTGSVSDTILVTDTLGNIAQHVVTVTAGLGISGAGTTPPRGTLTLSASGGSGAGFTWSLASNNSGGTMVAATGVYTAGSTGTVTDSIRVTDSLGNTLTTSIPVGAAITIAPSPLTLTTGNTQTFTATGGSGANYGWSLVGNNSGGVIAAGTGVYTAGATGSGQVTDTVRVIDNLGNLATGRITVNYLPPVSPVIAAATYVTTGKAGLQASIQDQGAGMTYLWSLSNGTLTGGQGTSQISYTPGAIGTFTASVSVSNVVNAVSGSAQATVVAAPSAGIFAQNLVFYGNTPILASTPPQAGMTNLWTLAGGSASVSTTGDLTANTLSYGTGSTPGTYQLGLSVQNLAGDSASSDLALQVVNGQFLRDVSSMTIRGGHTVTLLGSGEVLAVGGTDRTEHPATTMHYDADTQTWSTTETLDTAERYDPATRTWSNTASLATGRSLHTATLLRSGLVLVTGGLDGAGVFLASVELYDPASNTWSNASPLAMARTNHTATLLSSGQVLVTAGQNSSGALASAELYDPASNTWSQAGNLGIARTLFATTLLPSGQVLVTGGLNGSTALASAERYDPASNTWSSASPLVTARYNHTATLLGTGQVLVAAGQNGTGTIADAELYAPGSNTWSAAGSLGAPRASFTATLLGNGKVLAVGGTDLTGLDLASAESYDPASNTWSFTGSLATARHSHPATLLSNGQVLVAGGMVLGGHGTNSVGGLNSPESIAAPECYDPATTAWSSQGSFGSPLRNQMATLLADGKLLLVGGMSKAEIALASCQRYDQATATWSTVGSLATARFGGSVTLLPSGKVLVEGGFDRNSAIIASSELYDPATGTWSATSSMVSARAAHTATLLNNGLVLVTGGSDGSGHSFAGAELYDPATGTWSATGSLATGRSSHTATLLNNGKVLVTGGDNNVIDPMQFTSALASCELYDPDTGTWTTVNALKVEHMFHTATLLKNGQVLVVGGLSNSDLTSDVELYNPATGTWSTTDSLALTRREHTATLLSTGMVLVAGGHKWNGTPDQAIASVELYDPAAGTWSIPSGLLGSRCWHTATLLSDGRVVVVGGPNHYLPEFYKP